MNIKRAVFVVIPVVIGIALGVGGTIGVQKIFFSKSAVTTQASTAQEGPVVEIGEFTLNLQGGAFLKTQIAVEGTDKKSETTIKSKSNFIKDRVNTLLSSKTLTDMQPQNRDKLKKELISQLNEVTGNKIQDVLFLTFIYQ